MFDELRKKIYLLLNSNIKTFYFIAPTGETLPYCVFNYIIINNDYDTGSNISSVKLQVSIFANSASALFAKQDLVTSSLEVPKENYNTISAFCIKIDRDNITYDYNDGVYSVFLEYNIILSN